MISLDAEPVTSDASQALFRTRFAAVEMGTMWSVDAS